MIQFSSAGIGGFAHEFQRPVISFAPDETYPTNLPFVSSLPHGYSTLTSNNATRR
jgi:hypothetical protein